MLPWDTFHGAVTLTSDGTEGCLGRLGLGHADFFTTPTSLPANFEAAWAFLHPHFIGILTIPCCWNSAKIVRNVIQGFPLISNIHKWWTNHILNQAFVWGVFDNPYWGSHLTAPGACHAWRFFLNSGSMRSLMPFVSAVSQVILWDTLQGDDFLER